MNNEWNSHPSPEVAGETYDPYNTSSERKEGFFLGRIITTFTGNPGKIFSTPRKWHIFQQGWQTGFRAPSLGEIPSCPPLWEDDSEYFDSSAMISNVMKIYGYGIVSSILGLVAAAKMGWLA